jgi:hypothetical protein
MIDETPTVNGAAPVAGPARAGVARGAPAPVGASVAARAAEPRQPKKRPDPGPMRLALGMTGLAAATALSTLIIRPPAAAPTPATDPALPEPTSPPLIVRHVTQYVQLKPGETAPPGASVVQKPAASPRVVIVTIPAPAPRRVVVVTRQSGQK